MEQIFLKDSRALEFKPAWDLLVLGTNGSGVLNLLVSLSELLVFPDTLVQVAKVFNYLPLTLLPLSTDICVCVYVYVCVLGAISEEGNLFPEYMCLITAETPVCEKKQK